MILKRTSSDDPDFRRLVGQLDEYLAEIDGDEHAYYAQFNGLEKISNVVVMYDGDEPVGCGAFKPYSDTVAEIKRMYVHPDHRGQHFGRLILSDLESWAGEKGFYECILETGLKQPEAIRLYQKSGYETIPNYGQYAGVENSVCMRKSAL